MVTAVMSVVPNSRSELTTHYKYEGKRNDDFSHPNICTLRSQDLLFLPRDNFSFETSVGQGQRSTYLGMEGKRAFSLQTSAVSAPATSEVSEELLLGLEVQIAWWNLKPFLYKEAQRGEVTCPWTHG